MNNIRIELGDLFGAPVQEMNFASYMQYINAAGKITARSLMDITTILLAKVEDQEQQLARYEANFKEIEEILGKMVDKKVDNKIDIDLSDYKVDGAIPRVVEEKVQEAEKVNLTNLEDFTCPVCDRKNKSKLGLISHQRIHK